MNPCPKCGFAGQAGAASCARCGVVFSKLAERRPPPPRRAAAPSRPAPPETTSSFSFRNVLALAAILTASGLYLWSTLGSEERDSSGEIVSPASQAGFAVDDDPEAAVETVPPREPEPFMIPGFTPPPVAAPAAGEEDSPRPIPRLPDLKESTVTVALLEEAETIARDYPEDTGVREYIGAGYLLLAAKEVRQRRFEEALRHVEEAAQWSPDAGRLAMARAFVYGGMESWELAEKWARTALAYGVRENEAELHHLLGKVHYFREEIDKAVEEFRMALSLKDSPEIRASLERAELEARTSETHDQKRLSHFIVRYEGETMERTGRMVIDALEKSHATLVSQLRFEPSEPVVVLLYSRRSYREMGGPHWSAGLFDGKIRIPVGGLSQVDEQIRKTLHHELVHAFVHARAGENAPRWLQEGLAEYMEGTRAADQGELLASALERGASFEHCLPSGQCDVRVFYPAATSLVEYMIQNRGMGGIHDLLGSLGGGKGIDDALRQVVGRSESELIRDWEHFVNRRYRGR